MAESLVQQFLAHPRRKWIVSIATMMLVIIFGLPAYDSIRSSQKEYAELSTQLSEIKHSVANLQPLREQFAAAAKEGNGAANTVDQEAAHELRERVVRMIRDHKCRVRRVTLSDPQSRPWTDQDDPYATTSTNNGTKTEFQLTTRQLSVSATGTLPMLSQILKDVTRMHQYAVPTRMTLRNDGDDEAISLEMEFSLFDLGRDNV